MPESPTTGTTIRVSRTASGGRIARDITSFMVWEDDFPRDATSIIEALRHSFTVDARVKRTWTDASALAAVGSFPATMAANAKSYVEARLEGYSPLEANQQLDPYVI